MGKLESQLWKAVERGESWFGTRRSVVRINSPRPIPFNSLPKICRRNPGTQRAKVSGLIFWLAAQWIGFQETPAPRPAEKTRGNWAHQLVHTSCGRLLGVTGKRDNFGYASATLSSVRLQLFSQHRWQERTRSASRIAKGGRTCSPGWIMPKPHPSSKPC